MKLSAILFNVIVCVYALKFVPEEFQKLQIQVETDSGTVQGIRIKSDHVEKGYYSAYLGIPYAQPPLGHLRFKAPKWVENWSGVLDATHVASSCIEILLEIKGTSEVIGNEDCLFLNVFSATNPKKKENLKPVMVYIHGGAFWFGNSDVKTYGPDLLVSKDVVLVTFNYRLGVFGFLNTEDMASPGNYGLKDQNLLLRWVQKNIRNFGGDPDNVLLFGHSAGSVSINFHMISPKSRGLFHKAILQSGSALCLWGSQRKPRNIAYLFGLANGIVNPRDSQELINKLRKADIEDLKESLLPVLASGLSQVTIRGLPFSPSFEYHHEDAFLTENHWYDMLRNGEFHQVPVLMGTSKNETLYFFQEFEILKPVLNFVDLDNSLLTPKSMNISDRDILMYVGRKIKERFFGKFNEVSSASMENILNFFNQDAFTRPLWKTAELMSRHIPLYFYEFRYESDLGRIGLGPDRKYPGVRGVAHSEELVFLFNDLQNFTKTKTDNLVRKRMITMWTNFARYSNPTPAERRSEEVSGNLVWPQFTSTENQQKSFLEITESIKIVNISEDHDNVLWWDELFMKYGIPPFHTY